MRRYWVIVPGLLVAGLILAMTAFEAPQASADNGPHVKGWGATPDGCAACHRVHRGVNEFLLLEETETLCFSCHGNDALGSVLNAQGGTNDSTGGALRGGGFDTARIDTDDPSLPTPWATPPAVLTIGVLAAPGETTQSSHSVDGSAQTIWGNGAISGVANPGLAGYELECGKCHDPHGNGNYRILRPVPSGSGAPTPGYTVPDTYPKDEDTAGNYDTSNYFNMYFGATPVNPMTEPPGPVAGQSILYDTAMWCAQCHTRYLAEAGTTASGKPPAGGSRVDSGDAIFKFRHTSMGYGYSSFGGSPGFKYNNRACITCHAVHGSNATAGEYSGAVPDPDGTAGSGSANSKLLKMNNRGICQKCHNK